jgi:hypothetical protein
MVAGENFVFGFPAFEIREKSSVTLINLEGISLSGNSGEQIKQSIKKQLEEALSTLRDNVLEGDAEVVGEVPVYNLALPALILNLLSQIADNFTASEEYIEASLLRNAMEFFVPGFEFGETEGGFPVRLGNGDDELGLQLKVDQDIVRLLLALIDETGIHYTSSFLLQVLENKGLGAGITQTIRDNLRVGTLKKLMGGLDGFSDEEGVDIDIHLGGSKIRSKCGEWRQTEIKIERDGSFDAVATALLQISVGN